MANHLSRRRLLQAAGPAAAVVAAGGLLIGCGRQPAPPPNIILIVSDAMRADRFGLLRDGESITPNLDRLAAEGAIYTECYSPSSWTKTSMASILTGAYPPYHGVLLRQATIPKNCDTIADMLKRNGYGTWAVQTNPWLAPEAPTISTQGKPVRNYGFHKGFDMHIQLTPGEHDKSVEQPAYAEAAAVNDAVERVLWRPERPFFLYVHYMETHQPWIGALPREFTGAFCSERAGRSRGAVFQDDQNLIKKIFAVPESQVTPAEKVRLGEVYDEAVRYIDFKIAEMLEMVKAAAPLGNTIIIFTSDHGDELYEHGGLGHARTLYQEVVRVPCLIKGPGVPRAKVRERVSNVSIYETVKALACPGDTGREPMHIPLAPRRAENAQDEIIFAQLHSLAADEQWKLTKVVERDLDAAIVREDDAGAVLDVERYDLAKDPGERNPLGGETESVVAMAARMERDIAALARKHEVAVTRTSARWQLAYGGEGEAAGDAAMTEEEKQLREQLQALGYFN